MDRREGGGLGGSDKRVETRDLLLDKARSAQARIADGIDLLETEPLWVGRSATANTLEDAAKAVTGYKTGLNGNPCPLPTCPWCRQELEPNSLTLLPSGDRTRKRFRECQAFFTPPRELTSSIFSAFEIAANCLKKTGDYRI